MNPAPGLRFEPRSGASSVQDRSHPSRRSEWGTRKFFGTRCSHIDRCAMQCGHRTILLAEAHAGCLHENLSDACGKIGAPARDDKRLGLWGRVSADSCLRCGSVHSISPAKIRRAAFRDAGQNRWVVESPRGKIFLWQSFEM